MKILLVGEYSGLHNNLKEGLLKLGHEVVIASGGDGFKNLSTDISFRTGKQSKMLRFVDLTNKYIKALPKMKDFDVVQFINPYIFSLVLGINKKMIKYLIQHNKKSFLSVAGDDSVVLQYWQNEKNELMRYSWIPGKKEDDEANGEVNIWDYELMQEWNLYLAARVNGIIPIAYEYAQPYASFSKIRNTIPIPINTDSIIYHDNIVRDKLVVFHGLNRRGAKGTKYIEEAFRILKDRYPDELELIIEGQLPYQVYVDIMDRANVIVDQVLSYSVGVNALIAMAKGKVVLGGGEVEAAKALHYRFCPVINILPDAMQIVDQIEHLLKNKDQIASIGLQSRHFVEEHHNYIKVAEQYLDVWQK